MGVAMVLWVIIWAPFFLQVLPPYSLHQQPLIPQKTDYILPPPDPLKGRH